MQIDSPHGRSVDLGDGRTRIMGIVNLTPDSFSDGGRFRSPRDAARHGLELVRQGADVLDLGGESTRPGHARVTPSEQIDRILPVLEVLRREVAVPISIDTTRAAVAEAALAAGADWINDTSALGEDPDLAGVVAARGCPIVLMHRFDPPRTTAAAPPSRRSVMQPLTEELARRLAHARSCGIDESKILLDPGMGFGTLPADNLVIHAHIGDLRALGRPVVAGPSRKSFLGHVTGRETAERLAGTLACVTILALAGVEFVRVHDVTQTRDVLTLTEAVQRAEQH